MKKMLLFVVVLLVAGIFQVAGQSNQTLAEGQIFTAHMSPGAVHTYLIRIRGDAEYYVAWDDSDTEYTVDNGAFADIVVGIRGGGWGQYMIEVQDSGNYDRNVHRLINQSHLSTKRNPLNPASSGFAANTEYIVEVRGYGDSSSGTYRIVFY